MECALLDVFFMLLIVKAKERLGEISEFFLGFGSDWALVDSDLVLELLGIAKVCVVEVGPLIIKPSLIILFQHGHELFLRILFIKKFGKLGD